MIDMESQGISTRGVIDHGGVKDALEELDEVNPDKAKEKRDLYNKTNGFDRLNTNTESIAVRSFLKKAITSTGNLTYSDLELVEDDLSGADYEKYDKIIDGLQKFGEKGYNSALAKIVAETRYSENMVYFQKDKKNKITLEEFEIWMSLLKKVKKSILWLFKSNNYSIINLKKEAEKQGIQSTRIIFADRVSNEDHLARIKFADLFLDTFNYNAHTTASDALWANIPIITRQGKSFSARVCSSLLKSLELDELIVKNNTEYEEKALFIAKNKNYLKELKFRLNQNKLKSSLFDSEKFTRNLEKLYLKLIKGF